MSLDITRCLAEEYESLRRQCAGLSSLPIVELRSAVEALLPILTAHTLAGLPVDQLKLIG